jgi:hypothetical protein
MGLNWGPLHVDEMCKQWDCACYLGWLQDLMGIWGCRRSDQKVLRLNSCLRYTVLHCAAMNVSWHVIVCSSIFTAHFIDSVICGQCLKLGCFYPVYASKYRTMHVLSFERIWERQWLKHIIVNSILRCSNEFRMSFSAVPLFYRGKMSVESHECPGRPSSSRNCELVHQVCDLLWNGRRLVIHFYYMLQGYRKIIQHSYTTEPTIIIHLLCISLF